MTAGRHAASKRVELSELLRRLARAREEGRRVVFTNGCFDLLHAGHLGLLEAAAAQGDVLVVGMNRDATVTRLKGPGRPLVPFEERSLLLAGLEAVDWVVGFDEETPRELIEAIRPDVLVKGGDWPLEQIVGRTTVEHAGGRVVRVPLAPGHSTSRLVRRIRRAASAESP